MNDSFSGLFQATFFVNALLEYFTYLTVIWLLY